MITIRRAPACPWASNNERRIPSIFMGLFFGILLLSSASLTGEQGWRAMIVLIIAPVTEEVIFRLGVHEALLRRNVSSWKANLLVAAAFGLAHWIARGDVTAWLVVGPAVVLGMVYTRSRSLALCVLLHSVMNLIWLHVH